MVTKSFDNLLNEFNFLNTMLRKIKKTRIFNEDVHIIIFLVRMAVAKRPSTTTSPVVLR